MAVERLQKILSRAGVASRRKAEDLSVQGMVTVNGKVVMELGSKADLDQDHIKVDGKLLHAPKNLIYIALNKPKGCVTTTEDPEGRPTVMKLVRGMKERVVPVGRLDYNTEGLLLFTNDGDFANRVTSAKSKLEKVYVVKVTGQLTDDQCEQFRRGVPIHGNRTAPAGLKLIRPQENPWYEVKLIEGRTNQIKLMFSHFGRLVEKLRRVRIGFIGLEGIPPGKCRHLTTREMERFRKLLKMPEPGHDN